MTAEQQAVQITRREITATAGGRLRLLNPWTGQIVEQETKPQQTIAFDVRGA